jgi:hypothetical protein
MNPEPSPAGPTTIPECDCQSPRYCVRCLIDERNNCVAIIHDLRRKLAEAGVEGSPPPGEQGTIPMLYDLLARERRRTATARAALEKIKEMSTRQLNHLPSGPCVVHTEAWSVAQQALVALAGPGGDETAE